MTFIGKLFVLVNLALSLILATAAFGVYSSSIDWSDNKGKSGQPDGRLVAVKAEIAELGKLLNQAEADWQEVRNELLQREQARRASRDVYADQLAALYQGKAAVRMVGPDLPDGRLNLVPAEEVPGVPLMPLNVYVDKVRELREENATLRKEIEAKVKENTELTNQLIGEGDKKGLRQLLVEEREKNLGILTEEAIMEGLRINTLVEEQLILKRQASVQQTVEELVKYLKQKHQVGGAAN